MGSEQNKAIGLKWFDAFFGRGGDIAELMTDDFTWYVPRSGEKALGVEGRGVRGLAEIDRIKDFGRSTYDPSVPIEAIVDFVIAEGDIVVLKQTFKGRFSNGVDYENDYCFTLKLRDGKVAEMWEFTDTAHIQACKTAA